MCSLLTISASFHFKINGFIFNSCPLTNKHTSSYYMPDHCIFCRHAGVYTSEEVALITRDKLIRLQSLYIDQFKRLQHLLKEKRRRYLHTVRAERERLGEFILQNPLTLTVLIMTIDAQ